MAHRDNGVDAKIARLALAYGEGTKAGDTRVLNQLIEKALTKGVIELMDKGEAIRTYCYIEDAVSLIVDILFKGTQPVYNVGGKSTVSIAQLAKTIGKLTNTEVILGDRSIRGSPDNVHLDMTRTLFEFPREFVNLEEGLKRTINYQKTLYGK
jgi:nucleoside-diphosphate-sugar epimerase